MKPNKEKIHEINYNNPHMAQHLSFDPRNPGDHEVHCTGLYAPDTPVVISGAGYNIKDGGDFVIKSLGELAITYAGVDFPAYGAPLMKDLKKDINIGVAIGATAMYPVPNRIPMHISYTIGFSNGIGLTCCPTACILASDLTYKEAKNIKVGDNVICFRVDQKNKTIDKIDVQVSRTTMSSITTIKGCLFVSMTGNLFLAKKENDIYEFLIIKQ